MELVFIRHGQPVLEVKHDGTSADPMLSELGQQQARLMANWLRDEPLDKIIASPLKRAVETAEALGTQRSMPVELDPMLAEFDRDSHEYIPSETLKKLDYEKWKSMGGQESGNSPLFKSFAADVVRGVEGIVKQHPGQRVALVCHAGVINVWTAHTLGFKPHLFFVPEYTSISRFLAARSGARSIETLNEAVHLRFRDEGEGWPAFSMEPMNGQDSMPRAPS